MEVFTNYKQWVVVVGKPGLRGGAEPNNLGWRVHKS